MSAENPHFQNKFNRKDFAIRSIAVTGTFLGSLLGISGDNINLSAQEEGRAEDFSVDMDPFTTPANTVTSLGSREDCARLNTNSKLDADEDGIDEIIFDVTAGNIPASTKMLGFAFTIDYPAGTELTSADTKGLLSTADGYAGFNVSEPLPDKDGTFSAAAVDVNTQGASGSGFLMRLTFASTPDAKKGNYPITISSAAHIDLNNNAWEPKALEQGAIAINENCNESPIITPAPLSPTPISSDGMPNELPQTGGKLEGNSRSGVILTAIGGSLALTGLTMINRLRKPFRIN